MTYADATSGRLKELIAKKGITISKLAMLAGVRQSAVEDVVSGRTMNPKLKTLHRLACGLDMRVRSCWISRRWMILSLTTNETVPAEGLWMTGWKKWLAESVHGFFLHSRRAYD